MKKGYYWIPPTDFTLNGQQYYEASVLGDIHFDKKKGLITFRLSRYFPVGSIFHFMHNKVDYIISCQLKKPGLWYQAKRADGCSLDIGDIERFTSGRNVYRNGFLHNS